MRFKDQKIITDYWVSNYLNKHLCSLCGNSGIIDTRRTAISPVGINSGRLNYCICPNGQCMRNSSQGKSPEEIEKNWNLTSLKSGV